MNRRLELGPLRIAYRAPSDRLPVFLLLGSPVAHSLSPRMQNAALQAAGVDGVYVAAEVPAATLPAVLQGLRVQAARGRVGGANVTLPHKQAVLGYLDALASEAALAGAVNTVVVHRDGRVQLAGHDTDAAGLGAALAEQGARLHGSAVVVAGSGGMARAAAAAALQSGARALTLCARAPQKASALLDEMAGHWHGVRPRLAVLALADAAAALAEADVLVQATCLGMQPADPLPVALDAAGPGLVVLDAVYGAGPTALLRAAQARGLRTVDGRHLLLHQGAAAFTLWTGRAAPLAAMRHALGL